MVDIEWIGHASFRLAGSKVVYIDPYEIEETREDADIVLITHSHYDHCSPGDIAKVRKGGTAIIATADCAGTLNEDFTAVEPGSALEIEGITITAVPAYNREKPFHPKRKKWVGYVIDIDGERIYHAGDTDFIPEMRELKNVDVALVPIGGEYTMNPEQAAEAVASFRPHKAIPMHWGKIIGSRNDALRFQSIATVPVEILRKNDFQ
ncbi:MBL fold metallo-hydrolase [Candidatus Woesearchaeota archaeon]|nr:MBL fold metallo-hydrolase [Candidatus Woesearchaeota archaeon]